MLYRLVPIMGGVYVEYPPGAGRIIPVLLIMRMAGGGVSILNGTASVNWFLFNTCSVVCGKVEFRHSDDL